MSELDVLLLRFDAPLMSFGGVKVDEHNVTESFPGLSMLSGLVGNALGYDHRDAAVLTALQRRIRYAVRQDLAGQPFVDYQTVDLDQDFLRETWTTRGAPSGRGGGTAKTGTHVRHRHYLVEALYTIALTLNPPGEAPDIDAVERALRDPERPVFIGRKACLPSQPLVIGRVTASGLRAAVARAPLADRVETDATSFLARWPQSEEPPRREAAHLVPVTDERDWVNQIHTGDRKSVV